MAQKKKLNTESELVRDQIPQISVSGDFISALSVINSVPLSLLVGLGEVQEKPVLVPVVNLKMLGSEEGAESEARTVFSKTLTLENAAFVIADLTSELLEVFQQLSTLSQNGLRPEPLRLAAVKKFLQTSNERLASCAEIIDHINTGQQ